MQLNPNRKLIAFIDEFGDTGLNFNKPKTSSHFIVTAIIMEEHSIEKAKEQVAQIRHKYFQGSEIKSSSVKNKHADRRVHILKKIFEIEFSVFALVIDKKELISKGFQYHDSFFKFCNRIVYDELYSAFPNLDIVADSHGDNKFIQSLVRYVHKHQVIDDLFNHSSFQMSDSKDNDLIQIADFVGGSIAKGYDRTVFSDRAPDFNEIIKTRVSNIIEWPNHYPSYSYRTDSYKEFDSVIADYSIRSSERYIAKYRKSKEIDDINRVRVLEYLLFTFQHISPQKYILTGELMKLLKRQKSTQNFRSDIIASLRDEGVIIASSEKGYKIPMNVEDIYGFVKRSSGVINPLIERVLSARNQILLLTQNKVDILNCEGESYLKKLI